MGIAAVCSGMAHWVDTDATCSGDRRGSALGNDALRVACDELICFSSPWLMLFWLRMIFAISSWRSAIC